MFANILILKQIQVFKGKYNSKFFSEPLVKKMTKYTRTIKL
jgi:hypothetical protein